MQIIIDRIHMCIQINNKHVVIIICVDNIFAAIVSCSHHVNEQK